MNIVDLKNKFDELSFNLIREYTQIEQKYLEEKDKNIKDLTQVNSINESMVTTLEKYDLEILDLNKKLSCKVQMIESLEQEINSLKSELTEATEEQEEKTKFDMIRAQNDEIHAKSLEIERLNKIIRVRDEVNEIEKEDKEIEIKPELTRSKSEEELLLTGEPIITPSSSDDEEKNIEVTIEEIVTNNEDIKDEETDAMTDEMSDEEISYSIIKYRKVEYYIDECNPPNVYNIDEDEDIGDKIGTWEKNSKGKLTIKKLKK